MKECSRLSSKPWAAAQPRRASSWLSIVWSRPCLSVETLAYTAALMINLLVDHWWDGAGPRIGVEQDPEGLLEPAGAVTVLDECGVDGPPGRAGLARFPTHRVDLLLGGQDGRCDALGLGSAGEARGVGAGRGAVRN